MGEVVEIRHRHGVILLIAAVGLISGGCAGPMAKQAETAPPALTITPASNAKNLPVSAEIGTTVTAGEITEIALTDAAGVAVEGAYRTDGSAWVPKQALKYGQAYTARVTATNAIGKTASASTHFTTMNKPVQQTQTTLNVKDGETYGVAMPVAIGFSPPVGKSARDDVERRLFVDTNPPQPGAWHWVDDGTQVFYRAPDFWKPGTKVSVRSALAGVPLDNKQYGDADRTASATIGGKVTLTIDNATKQMSVYTNDALAKKIPVSLGKSSTPTSSGRMVIMEKFDTTVFDTTGSADPYVVTVQDAQRLTNGGEFIHSAPWSVGEQGSVNTSHGCTNVSPEDARWLMGVTHVGDLVTITGTEVKLDQGNGWTAWDMSWDQYLKGSALKAPAQLKAAKPANPAPTVGAARSAEPQNKGR